MTETTPAWPAARFRKVPLEITAAQWDGTHQGFAALAGTDAFPGLAYRDGNLFVSTLEGEMRARPQDWIIRGVADEVYPCADHVFAATYERVAP